MIDLLEESNVIMEGHFKLRSGLHSAEYISKDMIWTRPFLYKEIIDGIAKTVTKEIGFDFDLFVGPPIAGAILAAQVSFLLGKGFVYPTKLMLNEKLMRMRFDRGFESFMENKRVVVLEDAITTGVSVSKTIIEVKRCCGDVLGVVAVWRRDPNIAHIQGIKVFSLFDVLMEAYPDMLCPMCKAGIPLTNPKSIDVIE